MHGWRRMGMLLALVLLVLTGAATALGNQSSGGGTAPAARDPKDSPDYTPISIQPIPPPPPGVRVLKKWKPRKISDGATAHKGGNNPVVLVIHLTKKANVCGEIKLGYTVKPPQGTEAVLLNPPPSVSVSPGSTYAVVSLHTGEVRKSYDVTVTATLNGASVQGLVEVEPDHP